jgi:iron complex transport system substrate-binding protein
MKRLILLLTAVFLVLAAPLQARPFTDSAGRTVEVPDRIDRVMAAGPPAAVLIYTLAPEKLAGWVHAPGEKEKAFLLEAARSLPTSGRLTGKGGADLGGVSAAKPDIIIDVGTIDDAYIALADKLQKQTGIPYVLIDGALPRTAETFRLVGDLIGVHERAELLARSSETTLTEAKDKIADIAPDRRPHVYYGRGPDGLETGLAGSINLEVLDEVGATNVAAAAGRGGLTTVTVGQISQWNPDTIIFADGKTAGAVKSGPRWSDIAAVKNGRVFADPAVPFGWFDSPPGVNRLMGIRWLEHMLYPDRFTGNFRNEIKDFYKLFYQVRVTDSQLDELFTDAARTR